MKKYLLSLTFLISIFALCMPSMAQDASAILKESNARFAMLQDFSSDMVYNIKNPISPNVNISRIGKFIYSKGKYEVKMPDQEIYTDGKSLWIYLIGDNELSIMDYDLEELESISQLYLLSKDQENNARYEGLEVVGGRPLDQIYLPLSNPEQEYSQARFWINPSTKLIEKIVLVDRRQTVTTYEFSNIRMNQGLTESTFVFDVKNFQGDV
jgi:outer membrane lipoprotein-sorting protein